MDDGAVLRADEFSARCAGLQAAMADAGLDALLLTTASDIFYVTGFLTRFWESPTRPWFLVVPARGAPVAVIPAIGRDLMARTWITEIRSWNAPDPVDDGVTLLSGTLCDLVPDGGRIGVPMGPETQLRMPLADHARVAAGIGGRSFADATDPVRRVREIKSEGEIGLIRKTCSIAGAAFARVPEFTRAGRPLAEVFRSFQIALLEEGADWVSYLAGGAGPGGYGDVISPADGRPLAAGDVLMLDCGAVRNGYFCDFDRNYAVGRVDAAAQRAHAALHEATDAALGKAAPGLRASDLHRIMHDSLREAGQIPLGGRLGHGLGIALTEWPSLTERDDTPLREGMVLTLEPGVEIAPGRIMVHEENIVLRAEGCELLSPRAPAQLPVIAP
ncbi:Xaa-Pro peptidase family protein [Roseibacterium sp. SDUM158017]|uniref:M24 family metallopeptidase n=1 Tax=Roseicyclus salinarum TaxID=3036773 RepID=UPI00241532DA|nr:Xaa-Pro peptidase family protein [Roseibacterium sp. SDUM158017]MDG4649266.1 Xaa-Pro peptidase family protein [Roseibacterium sp. SDUM158017]